MINTIIPNAIFPMVIGLLLVFKITIKNKMDSIEVYTMEMVMFLLLSNFRLASIRFASLFLVTNICLFIVTTIRYLI